MEDMELAEFGSDSSDTNDVAEFLFDVFRPRSTNDRSSDEDSSSDSDSQRNEEYSASDGLTTSVAGDHQYLGELEPVRGRVIMDDDSIQKIPVIFSPSRFLLVPGQTFPLLEHRTSVINILKYAVEHNHIFGIIPSFLWCSRNPEKNGAVIGTTAEIIACGQTDEGHKLKAIGRQRFKIIELMDELIDECHVSFARVRILPEIALPPVLCDFQLTAMNRIRPSQRFKCLRREASQSRWPFWVYKLYDEKCLVKDVKKRMTSDFRISKDIKYPDDATTLFYQLMKSVPIQPKIMLEGLALNNSIQRLNWLKHALKPRSDKLKCIICRRATIGKSSDIFAMSNEGPHGTYVNPSGYVHELITLKKAYDVIVEPALETSFSWFPKYAWQILCCSKCDYSIGWKFVACDDKLSPRSFYAIRNDAVKVKNISNK